MQTNLPPPVRHAHAAFTLVEIAIVLVVISLVAGGILIGRNLIEASECQSTITQLLRYQTAVNAFHSKYGQLPGDILRSKALSFGLRPPALGAYGDGNGLIESGPSTAAAYDGEVACMFDNLATSGITADKIRGQMAGSCQGYTATSPINPVDALPKSKAGNNSSWLIGSYQGLHYFALSDITAIASVTRTYTLRPSLTAAEAFQLDSKIDDGSPTAGIVMAVSATNGTGIFSNLATAQAPAAGVCVQTGGGYNFTTDKGDSLACQLRFRAGF